MPMFRMPGLFKSNKSLAGSKESLAGSDKLPADLVDVDNTCLPNYRNNPESHGADLSSPLASSLSASSGFLGGGRPRSPA